MADEVLPAFDAGEIVDLLVILRSYSGLERGAVFDTRAAAAQARSAFHVRRYTVVGALDWVKIVIRVMSPLVSSRPGPSRYRMSLWPGTGSHPPPETRYAFRMAMQRDASERVP
jgi:hypothetical protein